MAPGNAGTAARAASCGNVRYRGRRRRGTARLRARESGSTSRSSGPRHRWRAGIVDRFRGVGACAASVRSRAAARLEGSKVHRQGVPAAPRDPDRGLLRPSRSANFDPAYVRAQRAADRGQGRRTRRRQGRRDRDDACRSSVRLREHARGRLRRPRATRIVVEEFLDGEEASFIVMARRRARAAARHLAGPQASATTATCGPNTGGMGAYSPAPVVTPAQHARIMREVIRPTLARARRRRHAVHGLSVCRPHDRRRTARRTCSNSTAASATRRPQPILMRLRSDLTDARRGRARRPPRRGRRAEWDRRAALGVVLAAAAAIPMLRREGRCRSRASMRAAAAAGQGVPRRHAAARARQS